MSVYKKHPGDDTYAYDFQAGGYRFSGDTGESSKREAARVEKLKREQAALSVKATKVRAAGPMSFEEAAALYLEQVGAFHVSSRDTLWSLQWLQRELGTAKMLIDIDDKTVAMLVAKRRSELRRGGNAESLAKPISASTVNRSMTEPLRKVMTRAANVWDVPVGRVHWRLHMLAEPQERVREASQGEEGAILSQVGDGYREAVRFTFMNGCRLEEVVGLEWPRVDFFGRQFTVIGKGRKSRVIPMNTETFELLWAERNRHPAKVFTFVAKRNDPAEHHVKGERYPMTYAGLQNTFRRAARRAGVQNFHFHDIRHTAATRTGRKSSLTVVQKLLGHSNIATTARYTHAMVEDVRDALEAASPTKSPTKGGRRAAK